MKTSDGRVTQVASVLVGLLILGSVYYIYGQTTTQVASLASQNTNLALQNSNLHKDLSNLQSSFQEQVSTLGQQISVLETRTFTVVTVTNTVIEFQTTTAVVTTSVTTTSSVFPIPDNVTVLLVASGQFLNYAVNAGSYSVSGSIGSMLTLHVTPVFQGETITININLNCPGSSGPYGEASLILNGFPVATSHVACGGTTSGQITYAL